MSALRLEVHPYAPPEIKEWGKMKLFETVKIRAEKLFLPFDYSLWNAMKPQIGRTTGYVAQYRGAGMVLIGLNHKRIPPSIQEKMNNEDFGIYRIDLVQQTCNCPCYKDNNFCKHVLSLLLWLSTKQYTISPKGYLLWNP